MSCLYIVSLGRVQQRKSMFKITRTKYYLKGVIWSKVGTTGRDVTRQDMAIKICIPI